MAGAKEKSTDNAVNKFFGDITKLTKDTLGKATGPEVDQGKKESPKKTAPTKKSPQSADKFDQVMGQWSGSMYEAWDDICDRVEESENEHVQWFSKHILRRLSIEAPVVVGFAFCCVGLHVLNMTVMPGVSKFFGVDDFFSLLSPMQYIRLVSHIFAHDGIPHLRGNMTNLLLVGPSAEAYFGSKETLAIMLAVAVSSGLAHIFLGRAYSRQLGASGVVFALILLNSLVSAKSGKIPLSFVLTAFLWTSEEVWKLFFGRDGVSHHAHLVGAIVGTMAGYIIQKRKESELLLKYASKWKPTLTKKKE
jgi:membrane associated rhomboid family serine protease